MEENPDPLIKPVGDEDAPQSQAVAEEPQPKQRKTKKVSPADAEQQRVPKKVAATGYNYPAIFILFLFCLAPIIGGGIRLYDYLNPVGAAKMQKRTAIESFKAKLEDCYNVADKAKLKNVNSLANSIFQPTNEKFSPHQGLSKERVFWAKMAEKYGKYEECLP